LGGVLGWMRVSKINVSYSCGEMREKREREKISHLYLFERWIGDMGFGAGYGVEGC